MKRSKRRAQGRRLLAGVLDDERARDVLRDVVEEILMTPEGDALAKYVGEAEPFVFDYLPYDALGRVAEECASVVERFTITNNPPGETRTVHKLADWPETAKENLKDDVAHGAALVFLTSLRRRVTDAVKDARVAAVLFGEAYLAEILSEGLEQHGARLGRAADALEDIKAAGERVAEREREHLRELLGHFAYLVSERGRGRSARVEFDDVRTAVMDCGGEDAQAGAGAVRLGITPRQLYNIQREQGYSGPGGWRDFTGYVARLSDRK